jgi:ABC-type sugar transport system permease subunit
VFVGLANFAFLLRDESRLLTALGNTLFISVVTTIVLNVGSLAIALILARDRKLNEMYKALLFMPVVISRVASAIIFGCLLDPTSGFVNYSLRAIGLGKIALPWLGTHVVSLLVISAIIVWGGLGVSMTIYIAGLKAIPAELTEAASIDGAGSLRRFRHITLPLLAPALTVNFCLIFISCLKVFDEPWLIYHATPPRISSTVSTIIVWEAFSGSQFGVSAAVAVALFVLTLVLGFSVLFLLRARERRMP